MKQDISKHTLFEYLAGRATPLEKKAVEEWLANADNAEYFHRWLYEWELQSPQYRPDENAVFSQLIQRIEQLETGFSAPTEQVISNTKGAFDWRFWRIAASITMLLGVGAWLFRHPILYKKYETGYAQTSTFRLSDGSRVTLNANSTLSVPRFGFGEAAREVTLKGEAAFSVRHTVTNQRFVVKTSDQFQVEVLGTEFTVFARPRGTKVALSKGKIRLDYGQATHRKKLLMKPGELASINPGGELTLRHLDKPEQEAAWKEKRFVFDNTSVKEICALLQENFGVIVRTGSDEIASRTISGNFKAESADDLLAVVSEILDLQIDRYQDDFILSSQGANSKPL